MWRNAGQVGEAIAEPLKFGDSKESLSDYFYNASCLISGSVLTEDFPVEECVFGSIAISPYFSEIVGELVPEILVESQAVQSAIAIQVFYLHDALVDFENSDIQSFTQALSRQIFEKTMLLPDRFGRELYDKFNSDFSHFARDRVSFLDHGSTMALLAGTEQGVYQIGRLISGPLGIFLGADRRYIPIVREVPLWHCADTGCHTLHHVELRSHSHKFLDLASKLKNEFQSKKGRVSEWQKPVFLSMLPERSTIDGYPFFDLPCLLGEAFSPAEVIQVFERALLSENRDDFAVKVKEAGIDLNWGRGSPSAIIENTGPNQAIQFLSSLTSNRVVLLVEQAIEEQGIKVPLNEQRSCRRTPPKTGQNDPLTSVSTLGLRSDRTNPVTFMAQTIWKAYDDLGMLKDLEWRCRKASGTANLSAPIDFIRLNDPSVVVRELILSSRDIAVEIAKKLSIYIPNFDDSEKIIDKLLWKFGFTRPRYDERLSRIARQTEKFKEELLTVPEVLKEDHRERIRERGVNLFVNLEAFLEELVAYNVWLFWSDHFLDSEFVYDRADAIARVGDVISTSEVGDQGFYWNSAGGNTLGVLIAYANALSKRLAALPFESKEGLERPDDQLPHYDDKDRFVFRHSVAWADFSEIELKAYAEQFSKLVSLISRGRIDFVRNGLDHFREESKFPQIEVLTNFATFLEQAVRVAEVQRLFPIAMWVRTVSQDDIGRKTFELADYSGRELKMHRPGLVLGLKGINFGKPYIVPSINLLGHANSELCFEVKERSDFQSLWENYPLRQQWDTKAKEVPRAT